MPFVFTQYADITGAHEEALARQVAAEAAAKEDRAAMQRQQQLGLQARGQQLQYQTHRENLMARRFAEDRQQEYQQARDAANRDHAMAMGDQAELHRIAASDRAQSGQVEDEQRALAQRDKDDSHKASAKVADEFLIGLGPGNLEDDPEVRSQAAKIKNKINAIRSSDVPRAKKDELIREVIEDNQEFVDSHKRQLTPDQRIQQSHPLGGEASEFIEKWQEMNPGKEVPPHLQKKLDRGFTFTYERRNGADKLVWDAPPRDEAEEAVQLDNRKAKAAEIDAHQKTIFKMYELQSDYISKAEDREQAATGSLSSDAKARILREANERYPIPKSWSELHPESAAGTPSAAAASPVDKVEPRVRQASTALIGGLDESVKPNSDGGQKTIAANVAKLEQQVAADPTNADLQDSYATWLKKDGQGDKGIQVEFEAKRLRKTQELADIEQERMQHANKLAGQSEAERARNDKDREDRDIDHWPPGSYEQHRAVSLDAIHFVNERLHPEGAPYIKDGKRVGSDMYKWERIDGPDGKARFQFMKVGAGPDEKAAIGPLTVAQFNKEIAPKIRAASKKRNEQTKKKLDAIRDKTIKEQSPQGRKRGNRRNTEEMVT